MKGWRTILFNIASIVASLGAAIVDIVPNSAAEYVVAAVSIANLILRFITNTSVGKSE